MYFTPEGIFFDYIWKHSVYGWQGELDIWDRFYLQKLPESALCLEHQYKKVIITYIVYDCVM